MRPTITPAGDRAAGWPGSVTTPGRRVRAALRVVTAAWALALAGPACAPAPTPRPPAAPPQRTPRAPAAAPVSPVTPTLTPYRLDAEPIVDVGLAWDLERIAVEALQARHVSVVASGAETRLGSARGALAATLAAGGWQIAWTRDGRPATTPLTSADTLLVGDPYRAGGSQPADLAAVWDKKTWRGQLKLFMGLRGRLTIAARVPLESYLLGVVPGEIGALADDLIEAGRAQAIAARSYTLFYRGRRGDEGFDLYGTVEDQVYGPTETEKPLATRCVTDTRGMLALGDGAPIRANYCSTCGGITADVWEGWPAEAFSYLRSARDAADGADYCANSRYHRWREEWTPAEFAAILARYGPPEGVAIPAAGVGTIESVRVASRSRSGRVWHLEVKTSTGVIDIHAHVLRRVVRRPGTAAGTLRSNLFKIGVRRDPVTRRALAIVANGAGFGHGVGLCQTGALGMARQGRSARDILLHYYPGIEIRRMY